jgi:hypothetical protein
MNALPGPALPDGTSLSAEARRLRHAVAAAPDAVLAKVVAVFDSLPDRREADALLDAARPRLRRLRPPRPIAFARLLFLPLDGAILEPRDWRRQDGTLPRSALMPLAAAIRAAIGPAAAEIDAATAGRSFADHAAIDAAGRRLWRLAAQAGPGASPPPGWQEAGLSPTDYRQATALTAGAWRCADALWAALAVARCGPPEEMIRPALIAAAAEGPAVLAAALATLMQKAAKPGGVAAIAAGLPGAPPMLAERVLDEWLAECRPEIPLADPAAAAGMAEAFLEAFDDLAESRLAQRAERRQRVAAIRRQAAEACRAAYAEAAAGGVLTPLSEGGTDDAAIGALEATARQLRRLEQAGRALGATSAFDAAANRVTDQIAALRGRPGVNPADLVRMTEILAGPEAAMRLLEAG